MTIFGIHTGPQDTSMADLRGAWRRVEDLGYEWISIWDHFYAATDGSDPDCFEGIACHAALACDTSRVRCGSLVYSVGYRHPAVLAKAICAIDHLSNGRAELGLGAGWAKFEYDAYGIPFPSAKVRLDQLEEAAHCIKGLLSGEPLTFEGTYFQFRDARCVRGPVQDKLPLWIGGAGEQRTLRIAAKYADGWNLAYLSPEAFAHKRDVLVQRCEEIGRDPGEIRCSVNLAVAYSEESLQRQYGGLANHVRASVLGGSDDEVLAKVDQYVQAGADQVNLVLRPPFDLEAAQRFAETVGLTAS